MQYTLPDFQGYLLYTTHQLDMQVNYSLINGILISNNFFRSTIGHSYSPTFALGRFKFTTSFWIISITLLKVVDT